MTALYNVHSYPTGEWALPERGGWTRDRTQAGLYTDARGDKAAETMLDGERWSIGLVLPDEEPEPRDDEA